MNTTSIALIDRTKKIPHDYLKRVAKAIDTQIKRDVAPFWGSTASVVALALEHDKNPDPGVWPVEIVDKLDKGEEGFHETDRKQPYARVLYREKKNWSLAASHECIEMLIDPYGNRLEASRAIKTEGDQVEIEGDQVADDFVHTSEYLVEACDPCAGPKYAYQIGGVTVSDFYTPQFFDFEPADGARYDFIGEIKAPRQVLPGGYLSWLNKKGQLDQLWCDGKGKPEIVNLGAAQAESSLRHFVDANIHNIHKDHKDQLHRADFVGKVRPSNELLGPPIAPIDLELLIKEFVDYLEQAANTQKSRADHLRRAVTAYNAGDKRAAVSHFLQALGMPIYHWPP